MFITHQTSKAEALECVGHNGWVVRFLKDELKNDFEIGLKAVKNNGKTIKELSPNLRKNKQIVLEALKNFDNAYIYACESIKKEPEIAKLISASKTKHLNG